MFRYSMALPKRTWSQTTSIEDSSADSDEFSSLSSPYPYFERQEHHITHLFPFTLTSSFHREKEPHGNQIRFHYADNIIRLDNIENFGEILQFINSKISIRNRKYTKHLAFDFSRCWQIRSKEFRLGMAELAKAFPSLQYLHLNFGIPQQFRNSLMINDKDLFWLGLHITTYMPHLKSFSIDFQQNAKITPDGLQRFCTQIGKRLKRLENLTLDFSRCENIADESFRSLTNLTTKYLTHLKNFRVITSQISDDGMKGMRLNKNRYLKQTESLDLVLDKGLLVQNNLNQRKSGQFGLYLGNLQEFSGKGLDSLSSNCLQHLQNLKTLNLNLKSIDVDPEAAQTFVKTLNANIKTLQHVKIHFRGCQQITTEFLELFECPQNNQLKKLELELAAAGLSEESLISVKPFSTFVSKSLQNLKDLTHLEIKLDRVDIQDDQVKLLTSCIAQNLPKLELLHVNFFMYPNITGQSLATFREDFGAENALMNVRTLVLAFSNCHQIKKQDFRALKAAMKKTSFDQESTKVYFVDYEKDSKLYSTDIRAFYTDYSASDDYDDAPIGKDVPPIHIDEEELPKFANSDEEEDFYEEITERESIYKKDYSLYRRKCPSEDADKSDDEEKNIHWSEYFDDYGASFY